MAFPTGWLYKQKLTIQNSKITATLSSFPVLITRSELHNDIVDPSGSNEAQADGGDIRFSSDSAGSSQLACEIVSFEHDTTTGAGDAAIEIHVSVTTISSSLDTDIWIWYNTAGSDTQPARSDTYGSDNVWDSSFDAVWHLEDGTTPVDSTSNARDLTNSGFTLGATGKIGKGITGDGSETDEIGPSSYNGVSGSTNRTIESWFKSSVDEDQTLIAFGNLGAGQGTGESFVIRTDLDTGSLYSLRAEFNGSFVRGDIDITDNAWHYCAALLDGTLSGDVDLRIDAVAPSYTRGSSITIATDVVDGDSEFLIGTSRSVGSLQREINGSMDEVRVSSTARTTAWLDASFYNQDSPSTFIVDSTPESTAVGGATIPISFKNTNKFRHYIVR